MNLRFDLLRLQGDPDLGLMYEAKHPRTIMLWRGIPYDYSIPVPDISQWWFINCRNVPGELPKYLSVLSDDEVKSIDQSGHGIVISEKPIDGEI